MTRRLTISSPLGPLWLAEEDGTLTSLSFSPVPGAGSDIPSDLLRRASAQLSEYFEGQRRGFDLPLSLCGTDFQRRVWEALCRIPWGETRTYGDIAAAVGRPRAARAVGMACNRNPIALVVPCHRVVGRDGSLTGYGGGLEKKRFLLALEGIRLPGGDGPDRAV